MINSDVLELTPEVHQLYKSFLFHAVLTRLQALETPNRNTGMRLLTAGHDIAVKATLAVPKCPSTNLELSFIIFCMLYNQINDYTRLSANPETKPSHLTALRDDIEKGE
jgi:hypothetical protein